jgi:hypothetical protein
VQYGSFNNLMASRCIAPEPEIGMGVTLLRWTDRDPGTIVDIVRFKSGPRAGKVRLIRVRQDTATRTDSNGQSECQTYEFVSNPNGRESSHYADKHGRFKHLLVGHRDCYYDYSF